MGLFKKLFKRNWQTIAAIGFDYIRKNLLNRIQFSNPYFGQLFLKVADLGEESIELLTDNEPNDAAQMRHLLDENIEQIIVLVNAGAVTEIRNDETRIRVIAILRNTCEELEEAVTDKGLLVAA